MMDELLKKLSAKKQPKMDDQEAKAKLEVVQELLQMAQEAMGEHVKSGMDSMMPKMSSVEVSAPDEESLSEGLDMANGLVENPELEDAEELLGKDLDDDMEEGEDEEHREAVLGEDDEDEDKKKSKRSFPSLL